MKKAVVEHSAPDFEGKIHFKHPGAALTRPRHGYSVQFVLPVDNPVDNVRRTIRKGFVSFEVPVNYPSIHKLNYAELILAATRAEVIQLSTTP